MWAVTLWARVSLESYSGGGGNTGHFYRYGIYGKGLLLLLLMGIHNKLMKQCTLGLQVAPYIKCMFL